MEKDMATHASILAQGISWIKEPGGLVLYHKHHLGSLEIHHGEQMMLEEVTALPYHAQDLLFLYSIIIIMDFSELTHPSSNLPLGLQSFIHLSSHEFNTHSKYLLYDPGCAPTQVM